MTSLFKVLKDGQPCHGGQPYPWSLPTKAEDGTWTPGEWCEVTGSLTLCGHGLHLTDDPARWYMDGTQLYRAEYEGEEQHDEGGDKYCCRRVRLLEEVDWSVGQVFHDGEHTVTRGYCQARGSSHVVAWDSSHVEARGSSHVVAWDSSHVVAWDSSHVVAWDSSHVEARGSSHVEARGSSHVEARDSSHVEAWDSSHVEARGSSHVVSTSWHSDSAVVALSQMAAHVDRRNGKVVLRCGGKEMEVPA